MSDKQNAWNRGQATVKLVGRRKQLLEQIARAHAPGCSPVDAIDRALELTAAPRDESEMDSRLRSIEDLLLFFDESRKSDAAKVEAQLAKVAAGLAALHALISELAAEA